jgi:hypothetical protein
MESKMKFAKIIVAVSALLGAQAFAAGPEYVMNCDDLVTKLNLEATAEAKERFRDMKGSCLGVVDRNGNLYMHTKMVVRRVSGNKVTLYVPANDSTIVVTPDASMRVDIAGQKFRPRDLTRGQELDLYVSVDRFTQPIPAGEPMINEVLMSTETEELAPAPAEEEAALPTTG